MPHFTSQEKLKAHLNADQVTQLFSKIPAGEQEYPFTHADEVIFGRTSEEPVDPVGDNYSTLISIASRIVIWYLSGQQQWNDTNKPELDRREKLFDDAMAELQAIADGDMLLEPLPAATGSATGADERRTGNW